MGRRHCLNERCRNSTPSVYCESCNDRIVNEISADAVSRAVGEDGPDGI